MIKNVLEREERRSFQARIVGSKTISISLSKIKKKKENFLLGPEVAHQRPADRAAHSWVAFGPHSILWNLNQLPTLKNGAIFT